MKHTKIIAAIAVPVLMAAVFCACEVTKGEEKTSQTTASTASTSYTSEPVTDATSDTTTTTTTEVKVETDSLDTLLNLIKDYPIGTAGSTAKAIDIANRLLNFTQNSGFEISEVEKDYENFLATIDESQKMIYEENLAEIDYAAKKIIEDKDYPSKYLSDFTPVVEDGEISLSNYEAVYEIIAK